MSIEAHSSVPLERWMQISSLRLLVGIADHGSLSAGARAIGMAQPNASRALKTLERRLGYALITRSTRGSRLTDEGVLTVEWAREVLESLENLSTGARALAAPANRELTVGASMTVAEYLAPSWIGMFHTAEPQVKTRLRVMNSMQVIEALRHAEIDLGFVESPNIPSGFHSMTVWTDELVAVVGKDHRWANRARDLTLAELAATPLIEREEGSGTRAFLDQVIGRMRANPVVEFNSNSAICQCVASGMGPAVLSRLAVDGALRTGKLVHVPLEGNLLTRELRAVWTQASQLQGPAGHFLQISRQLEYLRM